MKVSIATADLPVWRSPMISSRWPRPIGTSASSALRPVCTGSLTDLRGMIPGALTSTRLRLSDTIGPLPSIGLPSASTTRPSRPLPTGTSTMVPVRLTLSPSPISASEPKITTPTLSASRLSAMPCTPLANSTISPAWTLSRPWMRAMPSPTESTLPTSETWASVPKLAIWSRMTLEILRRGFPLLAFHRLREGIETRADRVVDPLRTDGDDEAAEQLGIDAGLDLDRAAFAHAELLLERGELVGGQRMGGGDLGGDLAALRGGDRLERADHRGKLADAAVLGEHAEEVVRQL